MFVNDTGRLPDSGRVCVMGFQPDSSGTRTYFSLFINAARAEVEPMAEPRNPAHVLGVGAEIASVNGPVFAAYFAASRERFMLAACSSCVPCDMLMRTALMPALIIASMVAGVFDAGPSVARIFAFLIRSILQ